MTTVQRFCCFLAMAAFAAASMAAPTGDAPVAATSPTYAAAQAALEQGDAEQALALLASAPPPATLAEEAELRLLRGLALRDLGRDDEAMDALSGGLVLAMSAPEPLRQRAARALAELHRARGEAELADFLVSLYAAPAPPPDAKTPDAD